ncbi:TonB-dependent receptor [Chitinophagaceae bacterium 26-R-25]|nr:TonB-dependent receptor [Chitinophagaceae bacterium 26-R-25]
MRRKYYQQICRLLFTFTLIIFSTQVIFANEIEDGTGVIKGKVSTSDGSAAVAVSVKVKGTKRVVATEDDGSFIIKNIKPGNYQLEVSLIGYDDVLQDVTVTEKATSNVAIKLTVTNKQLEEVIVSGSGKLTKKESDYVAKMPLKNMENPQVFAVISGATLKEQLISSYDEAVKNAPGIDKLWSSTGREGDGTSYYSLRGFAVQPTLVNGLPGLTNGGLEISNIERIEVVKGPSGTLYGSSLISYGGLINTVTKKPFSNFRGDISYTGGSYGLNRFTADINAPLDKTGKVLLRVNGAFHNENSFQDAGFKKIRFFAPSLSYQVSDKLSFLLNAEFLGQESTNPMMLFFDRSAPLLAKNLDELGYNKKMSFTSNNLSIKTPVTTLQALMNYKLSDHWTSQTVVSQSTARSEGYYSYLYEVSQYIPGYPNIPGVFGRYINKQNGSTNTFDVQQNFMGDVKFGNMRNRLVAGLDYFNRNTISNGTDYAGMGMVTMTDPQTDLLTQPHVDSALQSAAGSNSNTTQQVYSAYASDVFNFTPELSVMASLRVDHFKNGGMTSASADQYEQTAFSPKFGIVYQPIRDKVSLFVNYMNGFSNTAPREVVDNGKTSMKTFRPEKANQFEGGVKLSLIKNKVVATVSYYDILVSNIVMSDPANDSTTTKYIQGGKRYSKGFEADVAANPVAGLDFIVGYSYNNSKVTKTDAKDYIDRRPEEAGPKHLANAWITYKFTSGAVKGFGAGFGGNYASENMILNRTTTGVFTLPSYTVLNASLFYNADKFTITAKLDNITNKEYYKGWSTIEPQMPRRFAAGISFRF